MPHGESGRPGRPVDPRLVRYASAARGYLTLTVALGLVGTGLILAQAGLLAYVLSAAVTGTGLAALRSPLIALGGVLVARAATSYGGEVAALRAAAAVKSQLRRRLLGHALHRGPIWLASAGHGPAGQPADLDPHPAADSPARDGELAALATKGLDGLDAYFARYLPQLVLACLVPLAVLITVGVADWLSALIIAATLPLVPVFAILVGLHTKARTQRQWLLLARLGGHFLDVVEGLPTLRVFGRARAQEATISEMTGQYRVATMGTLRVAFLSALVLELTATLATALVAVEVGLRLLAGHLGYETALFVLLLTPEAFLPLRNAGAQFHASIEGATAAARVFEILDQGAGDTAQTGTAVGTIQTGTAQTGTAQAGAGTGSTGLGLAVAGRTSGPAAAVDVRRQAIVMWDVCVVYPGRRAPALSGVTLEIAPGEQVVVTGASGAGKTSLLALLLRFAQPTAGRIEIGGVDLATVAPAVWRDQVAWLPQRPHLFDDTVAGNIALGRPDASLADIRAAADAAGADGFIVGLEAGYQTQVGERGLRLSSGQRQKIAVARAFLRDAPLLLLDEPTAHLDPFSAAQVSASIAALMSGRTVIHVTHRAAGDVPGVRHLVLDAGRLVSGPGVPATATVMLPGAADGQLLGEP